MNNDLYKLKNNLVSELEELGRQGINKSSLETIDKLAHAAKNVAKVIECCEEDEHSNGMGYSRRMSYGHEPSMDYVRPDGSYRDGGASYARRRDSMGRYSGEGGVDEHTKEELRKLIEKM